MNTGNWRLPAEWEKQKGVLLCFPHNGNDWPGKFQAVQWAFVEFIKKIASFEEVLIVIASEKLKNRLLEMLARSHVRLERISFIFQKTNRSWMRDSGPIIVTKGRERKALDFNFRGWSKYNNYHLDRHVPGTVADHLGLELERAVFKGKPVTIEGGAIEVNGKGTLLATEECLLDQVIQVRNPGMTKSDYENLFEEFLGVKNVIWLSKGIVGDDTHGHTDDLTRFVNANTLVTVVEKNRDDENYKALQQNLDLLQRSYLEDGSRPTIVALPMPQPIIFEGLRIPASYANFLIINRAVLVPTFNDPNDRIALNLLDACFPDREVIGISAVDLIWGFGTLHCLSQQIPE